MCVTDLKVMAVLKITITWYEKNVIKKSIQHKTFFLRHYTTSVMLAETEKLCSSKLTLFTNTVCVALKGGQKNFLQVLTQKVARMPQLV